MSRGARRLRSALALAAVVLAIGIGALVHWWPRAPRPVPPGLVPATWAEFRTSPGHQAHVGRANIQCGSCHDFEREGFRNPGTAVCKNCHARETALAHRGGTGTEATGCLSCHFFAPDRAEPKCVDCHAERHGQAAAIEQHATADCARCHHVHDSPSIAAADCTGCHEERSTEHGQHSGSKGCLDCHRAHAPAAVALSTCSTCHAQPAGPRPADHDSCVGCHQPHSFVAGGDNACVRCHGDKTTLAATIAPAHAVCTSCHTPHDPAGASTSCGGCHGEIRVGHGNEGACVTCHSPHGGDPDVLATPCSHCHRSIASSDTTAHAGGITCKTCHIPHEFLPDNPGTICTRCHAQEVALVATNAGHRACTSCHGALAAHEPARAPACGQCHAAEQASAPPGHAKCAGCHDPHGGLPTPPCATCHRTESRGAHESIQGGCETCHRPHGPQGVSSPPACPTCHAPASLPALHEAPGHAECGRCHVTPHAPARDDRTTCTGACHADRRDHQPQAAVCTGCHVFRR
ncbi:MAG TPA: hypothetical protein VEK07_14840 [Polyangiaceae bacterium]|nr:hypothetical protein [Polyangiaceae bacterium]